MSFPSHYRRLCLLAAAIVALGCRQSDQIQSYTVPKDSTRGESALAGATSPSAPTDRLLAAILPDGGRAWFFKVVGPVAAVDKQADEIAEFFATIRPASDQPLPSWKLPAGWTQEPGNEMRAATIVIPGDKRLELTVTSLGWQGQREDLLSNINRWRGQMKLPPIGPEQLADTTRELKVEGATMTVVDLRGRFQSGGMMAPFAGGPPHTGEVASATGSPSAPPTAPNELPTGHPPIGPGQSPAAPPGEVAPSIMPKFDVPPTWKAVALPPGSMRKASFLVTEGSQQANVGLIDFSTKEGPMIADPLANVNRWSREVGLPEIKQDDLSSATETIDIDGQKATYASMIPDAAQPGQSQNDRATLAAIVPQGDRVWFIKLSGDRDLVAAEQERFKSFLKSVRFTADRGAPDGN